MSQTLQFTAAVFSSREDIETLARTITFLLQADRANAAISIDVLVNGNESLARKCAEQFRQSTYCPIRIFHFSYADKAKTWNEYVHSFHPGGDYTFFLDGYAAVEPQALLALVHAHRAQPEALAASGIQRYGPSARRVMAWQMARGGLSGNLYMLPCSTISRCGRPASACPSVSIEPTRRLEQRYSSTSIPSARYGIPTALSRSLKRVSLIRFRDSGAGRTCACLHADECVRRAAS